MLGVLLPALCGMGSSSGNSADADKILSGDNIIYEAPNANVAPPDGASDEVWEAYYNTNRYGGTATAAEREIQIRVDQYARKYNDWVSKHPTMETARMESHLISATSHGSNLNSIYIKQWNEWQARKPLPEHFSITQQDVETYYPNLPAEPQPMI